jgi:hypothetical protein
MTAGLRTWRRPAAAGLTVAALVSASVVGRVASASAAVTSQQVAVPSYIPPNADPGAWNRLIGADSEKVGIVVANVANGPDFQAKPYWTDVMARSHASGKRVLGYVDTGYLGLTGQRTRLGSPRAGDWIVQIQQDISRWYALYPGMLDGIFFDQGYNQCGEGDAIALQYRFVHEFQKQHHRGSMTVLNPGATVPQCYEDSADVLLTYESSYAGYMLTPDQPGDLNYHSPGWTPKDPRKFWHIIYDVKAQDVPAVIAASRERDAGYIYVTDDVMTNPYDTLPATPYWTAQQDAVSGGFAPVVPVPPRNGPGAPAAPAGVRIDTSAGVDYTSAVVAWDPVPGAAAYRINVDGRPVAEVPGDVTLAAVGGLAPDGRQYRLTVQADDGAGHRSAASAAAVAITRALPADQTVVNPTVSTDGTTVTYTADFLAPYGFHRVLVPATSADQPCWKTPIVGQCAGWMIEGARLFRYMGDATGTQWSWALVRDKIDPTIAGYTYSWTVPVTDLPGGAVPAVVSGEGYAPLTYVTAAGFDFGAPGAALALVGVPAVIDTVLGGGGGVPSSTTTTTTAPTTTTTTTPSTEPPEEEEDEEDAVDEWRAWRLRFFELIWSWYYGDDDGDPATETAPKQPPPGSVTITDPTPAAVQPG